jgi:hypothetical protein
MWEVAWASLGFILTGIPDVRVVVVPAFTITAYAVTIIVYAVAALIFWTRFRWKAVLPIVLAAALQDATWNPLYILGHPSFLQTAMKNPEWLPYILALYPVSAFLLYLWRKKLTPTPWTFALPVYALAYFAVGMPTSVFDGYSPVFLTLETGYVVASLATVWGSLKR